MKKKYIFILSGICFIIFLTSLFFYYKKADQDLSIFISSRLDGRVVSMYSGSGGERFQLNNSEHEYVFESIMSYLNNEYPFGEAAEIGDSVFKPSFSDILTLIKKSGKIYRYTFHESYNFGQRK